MLQRAITGSIFVAVLVAAVVWHPLTLSGFFALIALLGLIEFYNLAKKIGLKPQVVGGAVGGMYIFVGFPAMNLFHVSPRWFLLMLPFFSVLMIAELFRKHKDPFGNIAYTLLGWGYIALPLGLFTLLAPHHRETGYVWQVALSFFILVWSNDTFAYLSGRAFGKHKLFERISPNKTWEGFLGGLVCTMGTGFLLWHLFRDALPYPVYYWVGLAAIVVVFGSLGDLVESMFKRSVGIKDSGHILPGHGGVLDRFDGVLLAVPVAVTYHYLLTGAFLS